MTLARLVESRFGASRALIVGRAALGLVAVLRAWRGDRSLCRVALPGAACHELVLAVAAAGCEPVFCDVDPLTGLVTDPEWRMARSQGAEVAIVVHLYGNPASVPQVRAVFPAPQSLLIDDAAQALGSHLNGLEAGAGGDVGLLSFGHTKHIDAGNAAVVFRSADFADEVARELNALTPAPAELRELLQREFRRRLEVARARLRNTGEAARGGFCGLLDGLDPVLRVPPRPGADETVVTQLLAYAGAMQARIAKAQLWSRELAGVGLLPIGMGPGCVPWRYACRLPESDWALQAVLSSLLRANGMHVSNWYLPAHWFVANARALPGVERLSREVFQFWLDERTAAESIVIQAAAVRRAIARLKQVVNA